MLLVKWCYSDEEYVHEFARMNSVGQEPWMYSPLTSAKDLDATGIDFRFSYDVVVPPASSVIVNTFVRFDLPCRAFLWPRSRNEHLVGAGVIESSYTGPILVRVVNPTSAPMVFAHGDPLCQMVLDRDERPVLEWVPQIEKVTARGNKGGITGIGMSDGGNYVIES